MLMWLLVFVIVVVMSLVNDSSCVSAFVGSAGLLCDLVISRFYSCFLMVIGVVIVA